MFKISKLSSILLIGASLNATNLDLSEEASVVQTGVHFNLGGPSILFGGHLDAIILNHFNFEAGIGLMGSHVGLNLFAFPIIKNNASFSPLIGAHFLQHYSLQTKGPAGYFPIGFVYKNPNNYSIKFEIAALVGESLELGDKAYLPWARLCFGTYL